MNRRMVRAGCRGSVEPPELALLKTRQHTIFRVRAGNRLGEPDRTKGRVLDRLERRRQNWIPICAGHPAHFLRPRLEELPKGAAANAMLEGLEAALRSPNLLANERHCQLSVIRRGGMQCRLASGLQLNSLQHILGAA